MWGLMYHACHYVLQKLMLDLIKGDDNWTFWKVLQFADGQNVSRLLDTFCVAFSSFPLPFLYFT